LPGIVNMLRIKVFKSFGDRHDPRRALVRFQIVNQRPDLLPDIFAPLAVAGELVFYELPELPLIPAFPDDVVDYARRLRS
jgi:hypothetical protein